MPTDVDWRHEYPWGRKAPARRLRELREKRALIERRRRLLQDKFEERLRDFERSLEDVDNDIEIARRCERDRLRREVKATAYRLQERGVDVFPDIEGRDYDERLLKELTARLREVERDGFLSEAVGAEAAGEGSDEPRPRVDEEPDDGLIDEDLVEAEELLGRRE